MPWTPLKYTEEIFSQLRKWNQVNETTKIHLKRAIMMHTGLIREESIKRVIVAFETLGYIEKVAPDIWKIKYWEIKGERGGS